MLDSFLKQSRYPLGLAGWTSINKKVVNARVREGPRSIILGSRLGTCWSGTPMITIRASYCAGLGLSFVFFFAPWPDKTFTSSDEAWRASRGLVQTAERFLVDFRYNF